MTTTAKATSCIMDCPDTCSLLVTVEDGAIRHIGGSDDHPDTARFICGKISRFARRVDHAQRLLRPMRRTGPKGSGSFEAISWRSAVTEITARLSEIRARYGGEAILPYHYGGSNGLLSEEYLDRLFFARLGASRLVKTICAAPTTAAREALYGRLPGTAFADFVHARLIVIWGANPKGSNIHLVPYLKEAKRRGAVIVTIDPMNRFSERETDLHLGLRPGTDLPLALALIHHWRLNGQISSTFLERYTVNREGLFKAAEAWSIERAATVCGLPADKILQLAELYAETSPALLRCGWGLERNSNGAQAATAIMAIPSVLGKFGVRGGGMTHSTSAATRFEASNVLGDIPWNTRRLNMTQLGRILLEQDDPPIHGLFVYNSNPAATTPDQNKVEAGLKRDDLFTVVFDQVHTDTAAFADILLPATTFLETHDIRKSYGSYVVGGIRPVIEPRGESKSNLAAFALLGQAMGFRDEAFYKDIRTHQRDVAQSLELNGKPANVNRILNGGVDAHQFDGGQPIPFSNIFPERPVDLCPASLGPKPYRFQVIEREGYPFALITPASERLITSSLGEFNLEELFVAIHDDDARARGLANGDAVRVYNELGEVVCRLKITNKIAKGVALMPKGAWRKSSQNGMVSTALCPDHVESVAGGACFNDARVEIAKLG